MILAIAHISGYLCLFLLLGDSFTTFHRGHGHEFQMRSYSVSNITVVSVGGGLAAQSAWSLPRSRLTFRQEAIFSGGLGDLLLLVHGSGCESERRDGQ